MDTGYEQLTIPKQRLYLDRGNSREREIASLMDDVDLITPRFAYERVMPRDGTHTAPRIHHLDDESVT